MSTSPSPPAPAWAFVPLGAYELPTLPVRNAAAQAWTSFKRLLAQEPRDDDAPAERERRLRGLSRLRLDHLVSPIDWAEVSTALDHGPAGSGAGAAARTLVGQPHCGHEAIVRAWAERQGAAVIDPPSAEQILSAQAPWDPSALAPGQAYAIPGLERWFLRHANGLALVRQLLEPLARSDAPAGLIGCDSWAYAYLQRVWPLEPPQVLTLKAFDGDALAHLFARMASGRRHRTVRFRNARTGRETLSVPLPEVGAGSDQLVQLAAHCRGNVGVARSHWRNSLRAEPDDEEAQTDFEPETEAEAEAGHAAPVIAAAAQTVWVTPAPDEPLLPAEHQQSLALVLHALLVHGSLPEALLPEVLPMPRHECTAMLLRLHRHALVEPVTSDRWAVSALGYPLVRRWLRSRGHLSDAF